MRKCRYCKDEHAKNAPCRVHEIARRAGKWDRIEFDRPVREARWPSGIWGHADYWLGYYQGTIRDSLMKEPP